MTPPRPCSPRNCRRSRVSAKSRSTADRCPRCAPSSIPAALYKYGIGLEDVRAALGSANAHSPKGGIDVGSRRYQLYANDQATKSDDYKSLVVAYRNGAAVRLADLGDVIDSVENLRTLGLANGKPAVMMIVYRQPGANIIRMVDSVKALMPLLRRLGLARHRHQSRGRSFQDHPRLAAGRRDHAADRGRAGHPRGVRVPAQRACDAGAGGRGDGVAGRHLRRDVSAWDTASTSSP